MKLAIITHMSKSGEIGGAEKFYDKLLESLKVKEINTSRIDVICDESSFDNIMNSYLKCYDLDLSSYDGVISTKAPTYLAKHHNHVCYLMHTIRMFYDMFDEAKDVKGNLNQRALIQKIDTLALNQHRIKKLYTIGHTVSERLKKWNNIDSEVLYPGITDSNFYSGNYEYIFLPSRLHKWKRVDLVIESMKYVTSPVQLKIAGKGEDMNYFRYLAGQDNRIEFLGYVDDEKLKELYSNALVVPFTSKNEDYGYVLQEAFKSYKPVITCKDSGEPARFVTISNGGFVVHPNPRDIATCIDKLYNDKHLAEKMGSSGHKSIESISWENVSSNLIKSLGGNNYEK